MHYNRLDRGNARAYNRFILFSMEYYKMVCFLRERTTKREEQERMDITAVVKFADELRNRLDILERVRIQKNANIEATREKAEASCREYDAAIKKDLQMYCEAQTNAMLKTISGAEKALPAGVAGSNMSAYLNVSIEENKQELVKLCQRMEELCKSLNALDFDQDDPPVVITADYRNYKVDCKNKATGQPADRPGAAKNRLYNSLTSELKKVIETAKGRVAAVAEQYMNQFNLDELSKQAHSLADRLVAEYEESEESKYHSRIKQLLIDEDKEFNSAFFEDVKAAGEKYEPDYEVGSREFVEKLTIGTADVVFSEQTLVDGKFISQSPWLRPQVAGGVVRAPMILDLKEKGNILLDEGSDDGRLSEKTIAFIHQYIQEFILAQPSCRVNLCLTDFNDQCKFNRYAPLKALNPNVLFKGIVRNEREIDSVISDMESLMFDISDNKLSFNGVDNIFELNRRSEENPQSMHLMVLLDFPEKYSADTISHIEKIIANGNSSGIYTLIVRNSKYKPSFGSKQSIYDSAIAAIEKNAIRIIETKDGYSLGYKRQFTPLTTLPISEFTSKVYPVLEHNAKEQKQTVIPMAPMFELSDQYRRNNNDPLLSSKLIEIPIGKNGGEVQNIKFSTTGDNAAHALVIGGTGSGKSNLLHAIILSASYRYSPKELQIYLIDFKGGVEFKYYEARKVLDNQLPHIGLTGLTSEPEDGVAILTNIRAMLRERENLFRRNDVEDIVQYNEKFGPENRLPRYLIIIDEVQELFANERLGQQALTIMGELFKKGRAFGISILWASQTVPKAVGGDFKDKVLSQIGNRICLKLNNADDAEAIGFDTSKVRALNRPEKGLGIIYDGMDFVEFRVAYAEKSENRLNYIHQINNKWAADIRNWKDRKPLFIVGDDEIPNMAEGAEKYRLTSERVRTSKSNDEYDLSLGQDYISGNPFRIPMAVRGSKENCWIAGKDIGALRDTIGYAMLSAALENYTNADMDNLEKSIYYYNGELVSGDKDDLYCVLPEKLSDMTVKMEDPESFANTMVQLYKLRKERYSHMGSNHNPIFVFIHKMQILAELFADNKQYAVAEEASNTGFAAPSLGGFTGFGGSDSFGAASGSNMKLRDIVKELFSRGSDVGIHFVCTINDPLAIPELKSEFKDFAYKIVLAGVSGDTVSQMTDSYLLRDKTPTKDGVAFCYRGNEMAKLKLYQYNSEENARWLNDLLSTYR